ncbi:MAG TPA: hypothetical protein VKP61_06215 [Candidatus Acidoferrum sp.]|nr:hypothetical protein [Candidatus Acidoferrum sp.]
MPDDAAHSDLSVKGACLTFFFQERVLPVLERVEKHGSHDFDSGELIESFLWLHHGVEIDYFPIADSRRIMYDYFREFLRARVAVSSGGHFETWFTPPLRAILDSEFAGRAELFSAGRFWTTSRPPSDVDALFQQFLLLANGFAQNRKARPLLQVLATASDSTWQNVIEENEFVPGVERPPIEPLRDVASPNWTHSGFFATVDYMKAFRWLNLDVRQGFPHLASELQQYLRILKETQQWRLNFGYPRERNRFLQAGRIAAEAYVEAFSKTEVSDTKATVNNFIKELLELMTDWGAPIVKAAGA